jgi:hypothetical protein
MALPSFRTVDPGRERLVRLSFEDCHETAPLPGCGEGLTSGRVWSREDWFISTTQRFPGPPSIMFTAEETRLRIGADRRHRSQNFVIDQQIVDSDDRVWRNASGAASGDRLAD